VQTVTFSGTGVSYGSLSDPPEPKCGEAYYNTGGRPALHRIHGDGLDGAREYLFDRFIRRIPTTTAADWATASFQLRKQSSHADATLDDGPATASIARKPFRVDFRFGNGLWLPELSRTTNAQPDGRAYQVLRTLPHRVARVGQRAVRCPRAPRV